MTSLSRSPLSRSEYTELIADEGSDAPFGFDRPIKLAVVYEEEVSDVVFVWMNNEGGPPDLFVQSGGGAGRPVDMSGGCRDPFC